MKTFYAVLLTLFLCIILVAFCYLTMANAIADDISEGATLYVTASRLNGRAQPRKKSFAEALFDYGDKLTATGKWSRDHKWVQVEGGESGTVWVDARYVSEIKEPVLIMTDVTKVKIRKTPFDGKITGYLKSGREMEIDQIVLGWAHCSKGWIDLGYCYFIDEEGNE